MKFHIFLLLAVGVAVSSCAPQQSAERRAPALPSPTSPAPSESELRGRLMAAGFDVPRNPVAAPDFSLERLGGGTVRLSGLEGRVVLLNFWATWCPPCRAEMPSLERLHASLEGAGLAVVAVDLREPEATVAQYIREQRLTFTVLRDDTGEIGGTYGAQSIPTTWIVDRSGGLVARAVGAREWDSAELLQLFVDLLAAP